MYQGKHMKWEKFIQSGFRMPFYMNLYVVGKIDAVFKVTGWNHPSSLVVIEHQMNTVYESVEAMKDYREFITPKLSQNKFRDHFISAFQKADDVLLKHCRKIYFKDYSRHNLKTLENDLSLFSKQFRFKFGIYGLPKFTDLALQEILPKLLSAPISEEDLVILTKPSTHSEYSLERIGFLKLLREIQNENLSGLFLKSHAEIFDQLGRYHPALCCKIETHVQNYAWLNISHHVRPMTLDELLTNIKVGLNDATSQQELKDKEEELAQLEKKQNQIYNRYKLNKQDYNIICFIQSLNEINESRKVAMSKAILWSYPLFQALADHLTIDTISLRQLTVEELRKILGRGRLTPAEIDLTRERLKHYTCLLRDGVVKNESGEKAEALALRELGVENYSLINELKGRVAQPGYARGEVRLVLSEHQTERLLQGEILVTSMTDPNMVSAMKKAAAIITDEGGITCHAAIISRELKTPCVIGTKIATKVLKDGDLVEINATSGLIKIIKRAKR